MVVLTLLVAIASRLIPAASQQTSRHEHKRGHAIDTDPEDPLETTLVFGTREHGGSALWIILFSIEKTKDEASIVFVPAHTAVEVPGRGLQAMGDALASGGVPLLLLSAETLLGLDIDRHLELSEGDAEMLFEATGPISLDVPADVRVPAGDNTARVVFEKGRQRLHGSLLVDLLYNPGLDADDIELGNRHLAFWKAFFAAFPKPAHLDSTIRRAGPALAGSDADAGEHSRFFARFAGVSPTKRSLDLLPVHQVTAGGDELYFVDEHELQGFLRDVVGTVPSRRDATRVQVLNGNGVPGVGQVVADRLGSSGFKLILSSNARSFDYDKTLIISYPETPESAARRAKNLLGVGEIQVSEQSQGIVDLTIVVGKDFLRKL